jgi:hypothetical protein
VAEGMDKQGQRWSADEARAVLEQWGRSGQSATAFARARGFSPMRLSYWSKRLSSEAPVQFVSVPLAEASAAGAQAVIEIEHGGVKLRVREGLCVEHVASLCAALVRAVHTC